MAEQGCPPGQYPIGGQGVAACAPIPQGNSGSQEPRPLGKWIKTWGAVARDRENGFLGAAVGKISKREARNEARARCLEVGGTQCKDWLDYENQCIAIAAPQKDGGNAPGKLYFAQGPSTDKNQRDSVDGCSSVNGMQCAILYSACSEPILKKY
ncbi:DUF4189 domain-containing protein [Xanthomonas melonis]|uniref:DUF4189 domain-containing protein n=2 Tax=Xanthomonas melonis TaxID=56456 RepID=A0ABS8NRS1_9XANT|nr:DUF4189 domain-containing protein [Xanthomonas melonis]MCD0256714.1 DUF4189 domain-containing protein [Xanthomonas melonis]MCD0264985.1 DUF4189 domain-containing protein [Xanthomonas melonis]MCD0277463.1 DUF4189 domain-containing protein [Xanthomonas melonis]